MIIRSSDVCNQHGVICVRHRGRGNRQLLAVGLFVFQAFKQYRVAERSITHTMTMDHTADGAESFLTDADIQEFIQIYREEFKEEISVKKAREMANGVMELYSLLARPLPKRKSEAIDKKCSNVKSDAPEPKQRKRSSGSIPTAPLDVLIDILPPKKPEM